MVLRINFHDMNENKLKKWSDLKDSHKALFQRGVAHCTNSPCGDEMGGWEVGGVHM